MSTTSCLFMFFFFNDTATTEIYTLSLHDALPISGVRGCGIVLESDLEHGRNLVAQVEIPMRRLADSDREQFRDRKSTRLNSSHTVISYAVFCLKKKKNTVRTMP